jgi:hypothetical protein
MLLNFIASTSVSVSDLPGRHLSAAYDLEGLVNWESLAPNFGGQIPGG